MPSIYHERKSGVYYRASTYHKEHFYDVYRYTFKDRIQMNTEIHAMYV